MKELPLNSNMQGNYKYNAKRKEYLNLKSVQPKGEKKVFNIRLGDYTNNIWVNHKDYSNVKGVYTVKGSYVFFCYNDVNYMIQNKPLNNAIVRVIKLDENK